MLKLNCCYCTQPPGGDCSALASRCFSPQMGNVLLRLLLPSFSAELRLICVHSLSEGRSPISPPFLVPAPPGWRRVLQTRCHRAGSREEPSPVKSLFESHYGRRITLRCHFPSLISPALSAGLICGVEGYGLLSRHNRLDGAVTASPPPSPVAPHSLPLLRYERDEGSVARSSG